MNGGWGTAVPHSLSAIGWWGTAVSTFGPTLDGIGNDSGADDPGVVTVVKSFSWASKPDNTIDAYWHITPGSGANYNLTLQLCCLPAELNGLSEDNLRFWRYSGGGWTQVGPAPLPGRRLMATAALR